MSVAGCGLGIMVALAALTGGASAGITLRGPLSDLTLHYRLDPLSAFFMLPICVVGAAGSVYGLRYWSQKEHPRTGQRLRFCYGLLIASLIMVVLAADSIAFLLAWEVMALSAFFLVSTEEHRKEAREAGWLYLVSTHVGTLSLFALFALLRMATGSFDFRPLAAGQAGLAMRTAIFVMAVIGFGVKAGMMPFHFWLPSAHANAPTHISAILSSVVLKVGIYGLLRTLTLLPNPPVSWGGVVLLLGTVSAVLGVLFALGQHDLKRLLAYHSIENIGIILMGLGLALIGQARGRPDLVVLGLAGCLLHVWNHSLFKSLLFYSAGSVIHAVHTREIDLMGGLAKPLPKTALLFLIGAVAICGLPPLNGFISELFVYLGLFRSLSGAPGAALAAPALALVGALALACFVKAFGAVFLGNPRSGGIERVHEAPWPMIVPMWVLAICCTIIGILPSIVVRPLNAVIHQWDPQLAQGPALNVLAPVASLVPITLTVSAIVLIAFLWSRWSLARAGGKWALTWDCGYARPGSRMQYSGSSFAATLVEMFKAVLRPRIHQPKIAAPFPAAATKFHSQVDDLVLDGFLGPMWRRFRSRLGWLRVLQQGRVQTYVLYILIIVSLLLLLTMPLTEMLRSILSGSAP
ncbi:MAG TPA: proton-conducting transporter membrane subunit [Tepidisphaeraceae bacterium]|nr:proton-conducting transporter membrane subunit [Tepidisphaeraceae bacterium]